MEERELKLHVPANARTAIERQLRSQQADEIALHALYFDTAGRELARARISLRLRQEGTHWVQTLKAPGADALSRIEINQPRSAPTLDLSFYEGSELSAVFSRLKRPLALRYETRVTRLVQKIPTPSGMVELAYDQGVICAGGLELPISEIEFELLKGNVRSLFVLGRKWTRQHGLILDLRSKAERGDALAAAAQASLASGDKGPPSPAALAAEYLIKPQRATLPRLKSGMSTAQAYRACADECLNQIIRNTAFVAGVDSALADEALRIEYVHQLRVGIRRLRSCWRLYRDWIAPITPRTEAQIRQNFDALGQTRDDDVVRHAIAPLIERAGMPPCALPEARPHTTDHPEALVSRAPFQILLLNLLEGAIAPARTTATAIAQNPPVHALPLKTMLAGALNKWLRQIVRQGDEFALLTIEGQHDLRKKVKRLRYSLNFSQALLARTALERVLTELAHTQEILGELNDLYVAQEYYETLVAAQPQAWFAVGWLRAMQDQKKYAAQAAFKALAAAGKLKT